MRTIIPIILIIISVATFFMYINPTYAGDVEKGEVGIKQLLNDQQKLKFQTEKIREIQNKKNELEKEYTALNASNEKALTNLEKMIPDTMENARLVNYIYTIKKGSFISSMSDLRITTENNSDTDNENGKIVVKEEKNYKSVNLSFSFTSDYKNFLNFISDLYRSLRIVDIISINLTPEKNANNDTQDKFSFNIVIRTYWLNK